MKSKLASNSAGAVMCNQCGWYRGQIDQPRISIAASADEENFVALLFYLRFSFRPFIS